MKKKMSKVLSLVLVGAMVIGMVSGCGNKSDSTSSSASGNAETGKYTYQLTTGAPNTWSVTDWKISNEGDILTYTTMGLYDFAMNSTKDGYDVVCEMASDLPEDVTSEYAGNETYGVPADATEGYAFTLKLNKDACWEDGTPINADSYVYSMQQMLNPEMKNYRASSYYEGQLSLANAYGYYCGGVSYKDVYDDKGARDVDEANMYMTLTQADYFFGDSMESYYNNDSYNSYFMDADGNDLYEQLNAMFDGAMYMKITDDMKPILTQIAANFGDTAEDAWKEFCLEKCQVDEVPWENVGLIKNDDYTITLVLTNPITLFYLEYQLSGNWLIDEETFEAAKEQTGDIVKSTYGTAKDKYKCYGPWKIETYQADKSMHLCKNDKWYGWTDGKHDGMYQTTDIDLQFITKHTTEMSLFLQGKLDTITLATDDMDKYGSSNYIYYVPQSYSYHFTMNSDIKSLKSRETAGVNHSILSYKDFRHALSLSIDRQSYVEKCTSCSDAGYGLINYCYICNPETGELYRDSDYAKQTLCDVYNASSEDDITGYDVTEAQKWMQQAYDACKADGNISDSDKVEIDFHTYGSDDTYVRMVDFLQESLDAASEGTSLEGKITVNMVPDENYYDNLTAGQVDLCLASWGGADFDPYGIMWCYCTPDACCEYGFKPKKEKLTLTVEGKEITQTYYEWYKALCEGEYVQADLDIKNMILAGMEKGLLELYTMAPIYYRTEAGLNSQRVVQGSDTYINSLVGFGGLRYMTYTMDDSEWTDYCKEQGNKLTY